MSRKTKRGQARTPTPEQLWSGRCECGACRGNNQQCRCPRPFTSPEYRKRVTRNRDTVYQYAGEVRYDCHLERRHVPKWVTDQTEPQPERSELHGGIRVSKHDDAIAYRPRRVVRAVCPKCGKTSYTGEVCRECRIGGQPQNTAPMQ